MAAIVVAPKEVAPVFPGAIEAYPAVAAVELAAGDLVYFNTSGKLVKSNAGAAGTAKCAGVALRSVGAGQAVDVLKRGHLAGFGVSGMAYGAKIYASDTAGGVDTAAGTVSLVVASVVPTSEKGSPKLAYFDCNWLGL